MQRTSGGIDYNAEQRSDRLSSMTRKEPRRQGKSAVGGEVCDWGGGLEETIEKTGRGLREHNYRAKTEGTQRGEQRKMAGALVELYITDG